MKKPEVKRKDLLYPGLSYKIVGCAFEVYNEICPGHMEKYYQRALAIGYGDHSLKYEQQVYVPLKFRNKLVGKNYLDFVVEEKVVVEIKKGDRYSKAHLDQVLGYLRVSGLKLAILINFGREGVTFKRILNIY